MAELSPELHSTRASNGITLRLLLATAKVLFGTGVVLWLPLALLVNLLFGWGEASTPTLGMHAFLAVGTLWLPALAIAGFAVGPDPARLLNAGALAACGALGLVGAAVLSVWMFPDYPLRGPHELLAAALVLPAIVAPFAMMLFWQRLKVTRVVRACCAAWAVVFLGATVLVFQRDLETELPLSARIWRWELNDIQDYSNYYLRADGVSAEEASSYARAIGLTQRAGSLECRPYAPTLEPTFSGWAPRPHDMVWVRDDRIAREDRTRFLDGLSGCFTRMAWAAGSVYLCEICDFGI